MGNGKGRRTAEEPPADSGKLTGRHVNQGLSERHIYPELSGGEQPASAWQQQFQNLLSCDWKELSEAVRDASAGNQHKHLFGQAEAGMFHLYNDMVSGLTGLRPEQLAGSTSPEVAASIDQGRLLKQQLDSGLMSEHSLTEPQRQDLRNYHQFQTALQKVPGFEQDAFRESVEKALHEKAEEYRHDPVAKSSPAQPARESHDKQSGAGIVTKGLPDLMLSKEEQSGSGSKETVLRHRQPAGSLPQIEGPGTPGLTASDGGRGPKQNGLSLPSSLEHSRRQQPESQARSGTKNEPSSRETGHLPENKKMIAYETEPIGQERRADGALKSQDPVAMPNLHAGLAVAGSTAKLVNGAQRTEREKLSGSKKLIGGSIDVERHSGEKASRVVERGQTGRSAGDGRIVKREGVISRRQTVTSYRLIESRVTNLRSFRSGTATARSFLVAAREQFGQAIRKSSASAEKSVVSKHDGSRGKLVAAQADRIRQETGLRRADGSKPAQKLTGGLVIKRALSSVGAAGGALRKVVADVNRLAVPGGVARIDPVKGAVSKRAAAFVSCSRIDRRYVLGSEVVLAAIIAAAGIARRRGDPLGAVDKHEGRVSDSSRSPRETTGSGVARSVSSRGGEALVSSGRVDRRFVLGAEIACAALIASGGVCRQRLDQALFGTADGVKNDKAKTRRGETERTTNKNGADLLVDTDLTDRHDSSDIGEQGETGLTRIVERYLQGAVSFLATAPERIGKKVDAERAEAPTSKSGQLSRSNRSVSRDDSRLGGDSSQEEKLVPEVAHRRQEEQAAAVVLHRPTIIVSPRDTLVSIAEAFFHDANLGWLIADLNRHNIEDSEIEGKRVVVLKSRQLLELPVWADIEEFSRSRAATDSPDNLVTIVEHTQVDRELLDLSLSATVGVSGSSVCQTALPGGDRQPVEEKGRQGFTFSRFLSNE